MHFDYLRAVSVGRRLLLILLYILVQFIWLLILVDYMFAVGSILHDGGVVQLLDGERKGTFLLILKLPCRVHYLRAIEIDEMVRIGRG